MRLKSSNNFFFNQLSHDCRSTDSDAILEALSGHEEFYEGFLTVIVTVGTVIGCSAKTKFCQMAPKSTENH